MDHNQFVLLINKISDHNSQVSMVHTWVLVNSVDVNSWYTNIGSVGKAENTIQSEGLRDCDKINSISSI